MNIKQNISYMTSLTHIPSFIFENEEAIELNNFFQGIGKVQKIISCNIEKLLEVVDSSHIYFLEDYSKLSYFAFMFNDYKIVFGPFMVNEISNSEVDDVKRRLKIIGEEAVAVDHFYENLNIIIPEQIQFIYNSITSNQARKEIKITETRKLVDVGRNYNITFFDDHEYVRQNYKIEDEFMQIVSSGSVNNARNFPHNRIMMNLPQRAENDSLRDAKTRLTILNTLCNRAAIKGGIDIQLGHKISTNFGKEIERIKSVIASNKLTKDILISYSEAVQDYSLKGYSVVVKDIILKIRQSLTCKYSLAQLSEDMYMSKEYLSRVFKKETGDTVNNYINKSKIHEAKKLLENTNYSVTDIALMLGYSNNSYFSSTFKKITKRTPLEYSKSIIKK